MIRERTVQGKLDRTDPVPTDFSRSVLGRARACVGWQQMASRLPQSLIIGIAVINCTVLLPLHATQQGRWELSQHQQPVVRRGGRSRGD